MKRIYIIQKILMMIALVISIFGLYFAITAIQWISIMVFSLNTIILILCLKYTSK